jgi:di/tricarboxylate transporter
MEIAFVIGLLLLTIVLFSIEKISVDVVTIGLLITLTVSGIITPKEAFAGFSSDFIIILASIFVISGGLSETGLVNKLGSQMIGLIKSKTLFVGYTMFVSGALSAFMNNTSVTALLTGPVMGMCRKLALNPSKVLIPLAFASILGGTCTLIGTSTNIAVSGYIEEMGMEPLHFFEILGIGLIFLITGITFIIVFWKRLLPDYQEIDYNERYEINKYLSEIVISDKSALVGQLVFQSNIAKQDVRILKIIRDKKQIVPNSLSRFQAKDILLVECNIDELIKFKESQGIDVLADVLLSDDDMQNDEIRLAEVLILPGSQLINQTLRESRFRQNFDLVVIAIQRLGSVSFKKINNIKLKFGDMLLVQGTESAINANRNSTEFSVVGKNLRVNLHKKKKGIATAIFFILAIIIGTLELIPLSITFLSAALMTVLVGAISPERIYKVINWKLLILIGGMTAFGSAMDNSGASTFLAESIVSLLGDFGAIYVMGGFVLLVIFLTQPMSNAAAALVVLPVALNAASLMQADPRTFAIAIMLGASVSLIAPFEPSCILIFGPGKYKFLDFIKIGFPLTVILFIVLMILVPLLWPLQ